MQDIVQAIEIVSWANKSFMPTLSTERLPLRGGWQESGESVQAEWEMRLCGSLHGWCPRQHFHPSPQ
jgi:hypothetical protein